MRKCNPQKIPAGRAITTRAAPGKSYSPARAPRPAVSRAALSRIARAIEKRLHADLELQLTALQGDGHLLRRELSELRATIAECKRAVQAGESWKEHLD